MKARFEEEEGGERKRVELYGLTAMEDEMSGDDKEKDESVVWV